MPAHLAVRQPGAIPANRSDAITTEKETVILMSHALLAAAPGTGGPAVGSGTLHFTTSDRAVVVTAYTLAFGGGSVSG
jgi:hypothetical protein